MAGPRFKGIPVDQGAPETAAPRPRFGGGIPVDMPAPGAPPAAEPMFTMPASDPMGSFTGGTDVAMTPNPNGESGLSALWRGAGQGFTFGFGDEIGGVYSGAKAAISGQPYQPAYDASVAESRRLNAEARAKHPYLYGTGAIGGGVAGAIPMMIAAPTAMAVAPGMTIGARIGYGMMSGAGLGALQGAGEATGSPADRFMPAVQGGGIGAGMGAGIPIAAAGVGRGVQSGLNYLAERGVQIPGLGSRAANAAADTLAASPPGAVQGRLAELGPDAVLADASPAFGALTQGLASRPEGSARNQIVQALMERDRGTNARVARSLDDNLGPAPVPSQVEAQFAGIRRDAGRMYAGALENANPVDTTTVLSTLGARLNTAEGAERAALMRARDMLMPQRGPGGSRIMQSDPRNLHAVKEELDRLIQYGDPQMGIPRGAFSSPDSALYGIRRGLNDALEAQVPRYADANLMARTAHGASEALESGRAALRPDVHPTDFAAGFTAAPLEAQAAARLGMRADIDRAVGNHANDLQAMRQVVKGEGDWNRAKLATGFGPEAAERTAADIEREIAFRGTYNDAVRGSQTANKTLAAESVDVRSPRAARTDTDVALGAALGGAPGAAAATAVRAGRWGLGTIGRRSDIARNDEIARLLVQPEVAQIVELLSRRADLRANRSSSSPAVDRVAQALLGSGERNSDNRDRLGRFIAGR